MDSQKLLRGDLTEIILKCFYQTYKRLGFGFLEKTYENSLAITLRKAGLRVTQQQPITVYFEGQIVGEYFADLVVYSIVVIELKSIDELHERHEAQLLNYLNATSMEVGMLLNFGETPQFKRKILTNDRKFAMQVPM